MVNVWLDEREALPVTSDEKGPLSIAPRSAGPKVGIFTPARSIVCEVLKDGGIPRLVNQYSLLIAKLQGRALMMPVEFLIRRSQNRIHFLHKWYELVEVL
jgi:hypothetical protein